MLPVAEQVGAVAIEPQSRLGEPEKVVEAAQMGAQSVHAADRADVL